MNHTHNKPKGKSTMNKAKNATKKATKKVKNTAAPMWDSLMNGFQSFFDLVPGAKKKPAANKNKKPAANKNKK